MEKGTFPVVKNSTFILLLVDFFLSSAGKESFGETTFNPRMFDEEYGREEEVGGWGDWGEDDEFKS